MKKKGDLHMSKKSLRAVSGLTLAVALVQTVQPVLADESANSNSVVVKSEKLDAVAKEAAGLGFTTTTTKETRVAKTREEFERLKSEAKAELDTLASTIQRNVDADKQHKVKVKEAVDKVKDEEETIKAQYSLLAEKDGVRVYGKFNEAKKGSQAYYENIHAFTDREDITPLKDGLYVRQDSEITAEEGSTIHKPLDYLGRTFLGVEGKSPVGTKIKVSHVGDTLDGKRVDAHVELVALSTYFSSTDGFKKFLDSKGSVGVQLDENRNVTSGRGFTQSSVSLDKESGILYFYAFDAGGHTYKITYKTEDGTTINPMSALVNVDIDYGQGNAVSEKNLITGILSPESELTTGDIRDTMGAGPYKKAQYDAKYIGADNDKSIPKGSGIFITIGGEFEYSHFNASTGANGFNLVEHTDQRNRMGEDWSMMAGILAKDVKVKLHTPEIPTAPAIEKDFELKEIEVSLKEETTVEPTTTTTTTEAPKPETPIEVEKPTTTTEAPKPETPKPVEPITTYVDENGKQLSPPEKGEKDKKDIPGYKFVETKKKENGDTEHVYKKNSNITTYVDENGKELLPKEDGIVDKKDIPGYTFVETKKKENGDVEHVYKKVSKITTYVDENGKSLLPPEEGEKDKKDIPGYKFVETKKKENGDIEHIYKKVSKITTYVDENGKELLPPEEGEKEKKDIPGYEFVETKKKENGDIEHVYKKVSKITTYVDDNGKELLKPKEGTHDKEVIDGYEFVRTVNKPNGDVEHVYKKKSTEKKLPATGGGIAGAIAALAGLTGVGAYFSKKKKK